MSLPYVTAPGNVTKALDAIVNAATPERVSQDFVKEVLKVPGGSGGQITAYLKKIGMANSDGVPTQIYKKFRNPSTRGEAAAEMLKHGYSELYRQNEYVHEISDSKLKGLIIEVTGHEHDSSTVTYTASCFKKIKSYADFSTSPKTEVVAASEVTSDQPIAPTQSTDQLPPKQPSGVGFNLGYTINLNLPATSDIEVFHAIFKSLKENLLNNDD